MLLRFFASQHACAYYLPFSMTQHGNPSIEDSKTARTAMIEVVKLAGVIIQQIRDNSDNNCIFIHFSK